MRIFVRLDLIKDVYYQIPVESDISKTANTTLFGLFKFTRIPCTAESFQRLTDKVLRGLSFMLAYVDDVLTASKSTDQHLKLLQLFEHLQYLGLKINVNKCIFGVKKLSFLGHEIDKTEIFPLPEKIATI